MGYLLTFKFEIRLGSYFFIYLFKLLTGVNSDRKIEESETNDALAS